MKAGTLSPNLLTRVCLLAVVAFASIWLAGRLVRPIEIDIQDDRQEEPTPQPTKTIAIVDDDDIEILLEILGEEISYGEFVPFPDCESFMVSLRSQKFDLVILDYQIGTSLGTWCVEEIRAIDPTVRIVGYSTDTSAKDAFAKTGVDQFFCKREGGEALAKFLADILR